MALLFINCSHKNISISKNKENIKIIEEKILHAETSRELAHAHLTLAQLYLKEQMVQLAIKAFKQAQVYGKKSLKSKIFEAKTLEGIADSYDILKEHRKALIYHQQAYVMIKENSYQAEEQANILSDIAKDYIELGQMKKAIEPLESALNIMESIHGKIYPETIRLNNLFGIIKEGKGHFKTSLKNQRLLYGRNSLEVADLYYDIAIEKEKNKQYNKALLYYKQAIKIYSEKLPTLHEKCYTTHYNIATVQKELKQQDDFFTNALYAFDGFNQNQEIIFSTLSTQEKRKYRKKHNKFIRSLFQSYKTSHSKVLLNRWLNYKRKLFDEENSLSRLSLHGGDKISIQQLKDYKRELAKAFQGTYIDKGHIDSLKKKINELERKFSLKFFYHKKSKKSIEYQQISQILAPNELYIDFAKIGNNYYIFTLNHSRKVTLEKISITNSQIIEKNIKNFQEDINKKSYLKERGFQYIMGKLYNILFKRIDINKFNTLIISPDASLNLIPFETLYNKKDKSYLIEKVSISYIPSGRELIAQKKNNRPNKEIALFAKSDFSNYSNLKNLSYTIKESQKIKDIYPTAKFFKEKKATKENLFLLNRPKLLHLSTHGAYDLKVKNANPLLNTFIYLEQPISGLELSALNLQGTELVVLSACQTAIGKIEDAEGVSSMAKAFMEAGANNMLVSLWFINDEASSQLMELFYLNLKKGLTHRDALRQAKLILMKSKNFNEPYLWSAMVLMGK